MQQGSAALRCWCSCFPPTEGVVGLEKSWERTVAEQCAGQHAAECMFPPPKLSLDMKYATLWKLEDSRV